MLNKHIFGSLFLASVALAMISASCYGETIIEKFTGVPIDKLEALIETLEPLDNTGTKDSFLYALPTSKESGLVAFSHKRGLFGSGGWSVTWVSSQDSKRQILFLEGLETGQAFNYYEQLEEQLTGTRPNACAKKCGKWTENHCIVRCASYKKPHCGCQPAGMNGEQSYCECTE